jgi:hypothetical protein
MNFVCIDIIKDKNTVFDRLQNDKITYSNKIKYNFSAKNNQTNETLSQTAKDYFLHTDN